jgi:hypothetical protein
MGLCSPPAIEGGLAPVQVVGGGAVRAPSARQCRPAVRSRVGRGHHGDNRTWLRGRVAVTVVGGMAVPMKSEALYETKKMRPTNLKKNRRK